MEFLNEMESCLRILDCREMSTKVLKRWEMFIHAFGGRINDYNAATARNYAASSNEMNALLSGSQGKIPSVTIVFHFV